MSPEVLDLCHRLEAVANSSDDLLRQVLHGASCTVGSLLGQRSANHSAVLDGIDMAHKVIRAAATEVFTYSEKVRAAQKREK